MLSSLAAVCRPSSLLWAYARAHNPAIMG